MSKELQVTIDGTASDVTAIKAVTDVVPAVVLKTYATLSGYDTAAAFTVTGDVMCRVVGVVGATGITSTSGTTTLEVGTTVNSINYSTSNYKQYAVCCY